VGFGGKIAICGRFPNFAGPFMDLFPRAAALAQEPPNLEACLLELIRQIPSGRVSTYGMLAEALGDPAAARWIGQFLAHHEHPSGIGESKGGSAGDCPCHRVVRSDGSLGLYCLGNSRLKQCRLEKEGVIVRDGRVDLTVYGFDAFRTDYPLHELRQVQEHLSTAVRRVPLACSPKLVGAVDVAYRGNSAIGSARGHRSRGPTILYRNKRSPSPPDFPISPVFLLFESCRSCVLFWMLRNRRGSGLMFCLSTAVAWCIREGWGWPPISG
jgi:alkylated DNA nucleotide flippase Atl1